MTMIQNISPIDGSVYAEREAMSLEAARAAVSKARKAQRTGRDVRLRTAFSWF